MTTAESEANLGTEIERNLDRAARERLGVSLARLAALEPADLVHPPRSKTSFRGGLPYFQRTLGLFHRLAHEDLREVPSEYLKIVADDAEQALNQFREILNFSGENVPNPEKVRGEMISEVRDAYPPMYEDVALIIKPPPQQVERVPTKTNTMLTVGLLALLLAAAALAFDYWFYSAFFGKVLNAIGSL
jgi:hypothetical protein